MTTPLDTALPTKTCPGFAPAGIEPHAALANLEQFHSNKGNKDGLSTRCKACGNAYAKAWTAAKKAAAPQVAADEAALARAEAAMPGPEAVAAAEAAALPPAKLTVADVPSAPQYADQLALAAARGKAPGYGTETIGGLIYALPQDPAAVKTAQGQAALLAINEATRADKRRRDAERKRAERAAAKAKAAGAAGA